MHFDGQIIESSDLHELKRIVQNTECYWEIYKHIIPSVKNQNGNQKITILDMREMAKRFEDGEDVKSIAKEFKITIAWAQKIIKNERLNKIQHSLKNV